jgi:hypothetical protein
LISDQFNNRVIECTPTGKIVWQFGIGPTDFTCFSAIGVNDAERVGCNTLIACTGTPAETIPQAPDGVVDSRVILVDKCKKIIWQYGQFGQTGSGPNLLNTPVQCTFIPKKDKKDDKKHKLNGTVLITDQGNNRIIRVNEKKCIVWQYPGCNTNVGDQLNSPNSAELLNNGHVLIADEGNSRVLEVGHDHHVVKIFTANGTLSSCAFASRLSNGNTLITDAGNNRIVEVNPCDKIVWQYYTNKEYNSQFYPNPSRGLRLKNGDTLISDQYNNRVIKIGKTTNIKDYYGLALNMIDSLIGNNVGFDLNTTQLGLYCPYDAKIIGDYTGLTNPEH